MHPSISRPTSQMALAVFGLGALGAAMGWSVAQHSKLALALPLVVAFVTLLLVFAEMGVRALWIWAPLSVVTYPFGGPNSVVNFGRLWVPGLLALLLVLRWPTSRSRASSRLLLGVGLLVAVLGIRTALTHGSKGDYEYGSFVWIDSMLLPLIVFLVVRRVVILRAGAAEIVACCLMVAGLLLALMGIGEHVFGFQIAASIRGASVFYDPSIAGVRISGPYESPAPYGLALVLCFAAAIYWLFMRRRSPETYLAGLVMLSLYLIAIFFNFFRTGWLSVIIVVAISIGLRPKRLGRAATTLAVAGVVVAVGLTQVQGVAGVSGRINSTQNVFARLGSYQQAVDIFREAPVFGVGANRYNRIASQLPVIRVNGVESVPYPHDSFLQTLAEDGAIGFLVLLVASVAIWRLIHTLRRRAVSREDRLLAATVTGAALAYLLYSLTLAMLSYGPSNQFFAVILGLAAGTLDRLTVGSGRPATMLSPPDSSRSSILG